MKYIKPDYENSIVSLVNSIAKYFGVKTEKNTLPLMDEILKKESYKNIILVLYDGFGYNLIKRNKDICPFLNKNLKSKLSSVFPPTTTAATTSVMSGLDPVNHGWLGWDLYFKEYGVITMFLDQSKITKKQVDGFPGTSKLLPYETIMEKVSKIDGCTGSIVSPFTGYKYEAHNLKDFNKKIQNACNNDKKNYVYAYFEDPDSTMHMHGTDSLETKKRFKEVDESFKELCVSMEDSLIIAIADHGHINVDTITLSDNKEVFNMLKDTISIDSRAVSFNVKDEYKDVFKDKIKELLKDDFLLLTHDEIIKQNYFGRGRKNKYYNDAIGDYVSIGIGNKSIRYDESDPIFLSNHSGITEDEVYVPLIVVNKKKICKR